MALVFTDGTEVADEWTLTSNTKLAKYLKEEKVFIR